MNSRAKNITGWVLSGLIVAFLLFSATGKFMPWEGKEEMFAKMGWEINVMYYIGAVEILAAVLFLIPRVAFVGAILLTAYLGGAIATHVRVDEGFVIPLIMGILVWVALGLRDGRIFQLAFFNAVPGSD
jgi:uncharacterized membrane protein YphA (DoxX/SURF4 family)